MTEDVGITGRYNLYKVLVSKNFVQVIIGGFAEFDSVIGVLCGYIPPANCVWLLQLYHGGLAEFDPVIGVLCGTIPPANCVWLL